MKIYEAIRIGCKLVPQQCFKEYYIENITIDEDGYAETDGHTASCALGAAADGIYQDAEDIDFYIAFCLTEAPVDCPDCSKNDKLVEMIPHINDAHRWSRERIANWLEAIDKDQMWEG